MRIAETRAVNRAPAKGVWHRPLFRGGAGVALEQVGSASDQASTTNHPTNSSSNGNPFADQLCLLIREHNLNATLVKHTPPTSAARRP